MTAPRRNALLSIIVRLCVCVILIAASISVCVALIKSKPLPARSDHANTAPRVLVMEARPVEVRRQWDVFGTAQAMDSADVPARVTATVTEIPDDVLAGAWVDKGQLLAKLEESDFVRQEEIAAHSIADTEAQLARLTVELTSWEKRMTLAEQLVELAQAEFDRAIQAQERGGAKQREVDLTKQALISAIRDETVTREALDKLPKQRAGLEAMLLKQKAQRRLAQQNVERCRVVSPIAGVLQSVDVEAGENLAPGQRIARVVDLSRIEVPLRVPASARAYIAVDSEVKIHASGNPDRSWIARVSRIAPEDDRSTRTTSVFVEIEQDPGNSRGLAPGLFLRGALTSSEPQQRWIVPRRAITGDRILLVDHGMIVSRSMSVDFQIEGRFPELGPPDDQWVVLRDPLTEGDLVVAAASRSLQDGMAVKAVTSSVPSEDMTRQIEEATK